MVTLLGFGLNRETPVGDVHAKASIQNIIS
jgi:hypothetical protein